MLTTAIPYSDMPLRIASELFQIAAIRANTFDSEEGRFHAGRVVSSGRTEGGYNLYYPSTISVERIEDARITLITVDTPSNIMRNALGATNLEPRFAFPCFSPLNKISLPAYKTSPILLHAVNFSSYDLLFLFLFFLPKNNVIIRSYLDIEIFHFLRIFPLLIRAFSSLELTMQLQRSQRSLRTKKAEKSKRIQFGESINRR